MIQISINHTSNLHTIKTKPYLKSSTGIIIVFQFFKCNKVYYAKIARNKDEIIFNQHTYQSICCFVEYICCGYNFQRQAWNISTSLSAHKLSIMLTPYQILFTTKLFSWRHVCIFFLYITWNFYFLFYLTGKFIIY